ncbi:hypothetical protein N8I77_002811 [Diaporthe amygdali]|uniref:Uncharacterized protein n=1 Tax=Phomopsis amygdali TaxID=1214568 RepID=A0AAD9SUW8_PHOAM|nr:hypothetical protein N8I77_002811 [Diaporthe amygdali]
MSNRTYAAPAADGKWYFGIFGVNVRAPFVPDEPVPSPAALSDPLNEAKRSLSADGNETSVSMAFRPRPVPRSVINFFQQMQANGEELEETMRTLTLIDVPVEGHTIENFYRATIEDSISLTIEDAVVWTAEEAGVEALAEALEVAGGDALLALGGLLAETVDAKEKYKSLQLEMKNGNNPFNKKNNSTNVALFANPPTGGEYIINFANFSGSDWTLLSYYSPTHNAIDNETSAPEQVLKGANGIMGTSTLDFQMKLGGYGNGPWDAWVQYKSPEGVIVGVSIHQPFELFWLGTYPSYYVCYPGGKGWEEPAGGPSHSFNWSGYGYEFAVKPAGAGSSFRADATISRKQ